MRQSGNFGGRLGAQAFHANREHQIVRDSWFGVRAGVWRGLLQNTYQVLKLLALKHRRFTVGIACG